MAVDRKYAAPDVYEAIGRGAHNFVQHRSRGLVFGDNPDFDVEEHVGTSGRGRGAVLYFSPQAVMRLGIAIPLIAESFAIERAYFIAGHFAHVGDGDRSYWPPSEPPQYDPAKHRAPGQLFGAGRTWLVAHKETMQFCYFSDKDPAFQEDERDSTFAKACRSVGKPVDGAARALLDVTDVANRLARTLGLTTFMNDVRGELPSDA